MSKLKAAYYPDFRLEELVPSIWTESKSDYDIDYTIIYKPRAVIYRDRNDQKKITRETEVHKFNDDTLTRILEKLDDMIKDYELFKFNPGMENKICTEDDKQSSQVFIKLIERRLKTRQIFRSLESFVSGRIRDIDYRLINRTESSHHSDSLEDISRSKEAKFRYLRILEIKNQGKNKVSSIKVSKYTALPLKATNNSDTDKIMARMDAMTLKMDAQYKELQTHAKKTKPDLNEDDIPMSHEEEAKFMQTLRKTRFYNDYHDRASNRDNWRSNERSSYNRNDYQSNTDDKPYDLQKQFNDFMKSQQSTNAFVKETFVDLKTQLETVAKTNQTSIQNLETKFDRLADKQSGRPSGSLPSNT
nr:reverse transcriptase domain-containing protein [Tanacetum cinerariifolium]